ncbi:MAG: pyruvate kinase [Fimbriimonadales bacterium]|nr:pyruvate kinase [Fimbriimonadales bacterium]
MPRKTKIVCTLGPSVDSQERIKELIEAGMNVARLNCSHGDWPTRKKWIQWVRAEAQSADTHVAILVDLSGPKFRLGDIEGTLDVHKGDILEVGSGVGLLPITAPEILGKLVPGATLLVGDGEISFKVKSREEDRIVLQTLSGGEVMSRRGVTVMGATFDVPAITPKDVEDANVAAEVGAEYVAMSYVRSAADVTELGAILEELDPTIQIVSKIESKQAVQDISNIIRNSDAVMVARGDLGLQLPIEDVPLIQKRIISLCREAGKPVITATQMMESMMVNPRPTRAEASDVANAILDGTDAIMLSGETAGGAYPIETVQAMSRIADKAEKSPEFSRLIESLEWKKAGDATEAVARAACKIAGDLNAKAILSFSTSGFTARMVAKFRPKVPVLCATYRERTARQVALLWGVNPLLTTEFHDTEEMIAKGFIAAIDKGVLKPGDVVVITAGIPVGRPGTTNLVTLMQVSDPRNKE